MEQIQEVSAIGLLFSLGDDIIAEIAYDGRLSELCKAASIEIWSIESRKTDIGEC